MNEIMNPVDFRMSIRAQRAKTFDLRRKVLLKNFFRNQNVFIHNATSAALESFDFSKHDFTNGEEIDSDNNSSMESSVPATTEQGENKQVCNEKSAPKSSENSSESNEPFSFNSMMVALPDSTSSSSSVRSSNKSDASTDIPDLDSCDSDIISSTTPETSPSLRSKIKRKFSLKRRSFSKKRTNEKYRTEPGKKSRSKLNTLTVIKSPKRKKTSFRKRIHKMLKSSAKVNDNQLQKSKCTSSSSSDDNSAPLVTNNDEYSLSAGFTKSVAVQTDSCFPFDSYVTDSENQRLRLENKHLKNKVELLLKLNENHGSCRKYNGQLSSANKSTSHDAFRSNQENKTSFNSHRVTRSHSVRESVWDKDLHPRSKPRYSRRTRSVCIPRNNQYENNRYFNHSPSQPFKPVQSFICDDDDRSRRKRRFSPRDMRSADYHRSYPKRPRNFSSP